MLAFYNKHNNNLYNKLVELSRDIFFYHNLKLKDTFETRILLIFIHLSIILIILKKKNEKLPQKIFDNIFLNIEYHLRELGQGDVAVNKKMKTLNKIFYDILLKIEVRDKDFFSLEKNTLEKHLSQYNEVNNEIINELSNYLLNFYNFCFELDPKIMLKGSINFKN